MRHYTQVAELLEQGNSHQDIVSLTGALPDEVGLIAANVAIEKKMRADGAEMFKERQNALAERGRVTEMDVTLKKLREMLKPAALAITTSIMEQQKGRPHIAVKTLHDKDPFSLALITTRLIVMAVTQDKAALTALCDRVCNAIAPQLETEERFRVGLWLVRVVCQNSNEHFEMVKHPQGGNMVYFVEATEAYREWEKENTKLLAEMAVTYRPMVVPPKPWTGLHNGGFYDDKLQQPFIRNHKKATHATHGPKVIPRVYEAVNKIQATGYKINTFVLDTVLHLKENETVFFKGYFEYIPPIAEYSDVPIDGNMKQLTKRIGELETQLGITKQARSVHGQGFASWVKRLMKRIKEEHSKYVIKKELEDLRHQRQILIRHGKMENSKTSKNRVIHTAIETAVQYRDYKAMYFPHNLDWRGRVYPITAGLTTQGTTLQKALLKFDHGKPLNASGRGEEALEWLKVHLANSYGLDKASWQDRLKWADENEELIKRVGTDPIKHLDDWINTDETWLFLAACEQMLKVYEHGLDAVIDISIPMDGTCNGAQHYAAMTRDTQGAYGVNVAPNGMQGLSERLKGIRSRLGNPKVTQTNQRITTDVNENLRRASNA